MTVSGMHKTPEQARLGGGPSGGSNVQCSQTRGLTVKKSLLCAIAIGGLAATQAQAGDILGIQDPLPDALTWNGITLYGTIDVGVSGMTNGAPQSRYFYTGGYNWNMYGSKMNRTSEWGFSGSGLSQSTIGIKIEEKLGEGFMFIAKADTGWNPWSFELADACQSLVHNNGIASPLFQTSASGGSRCGQPFNGSLYAGFSNPLYGTITYGRQNSLQNDTVGVYDPMGGSYAFSLIGFSGGADGGIGITETARWDNSIKYALTYGPVHAAAMYAGAADNSAIQNNAYAFNLGGTYMGFSLDAVYTKENSVVGDGPLGYNAAGGYGNCNFGTWPCSLDFLKGTAYDSEAFSIQGKYTYEFGGGFKDEKPWGILTLYAGYLHTEMSNPSEFVPPFIKTVGGYTNVTMNNQPYGWGSDRILQTTWAGAKFVTGPWAFTAAAYNIHQDAFITSANAVCAPVANTPTSRAWASNCAGNSNTVSGLVDYTFDKHFDVYTGVAWSNVEGGLANGFIGSLENVTYMSGVRIKF